MCRAPAKASLRNRRENKSSGREPCIIIITIIITIIFIIIIIIITIIISSPSHLSGLCIINMTKGFTFKRFLGWYMLSISFQCKAVERHCSINAIPWLYILIKLLKCMCSKLQIMCQICITCLSKTHSHLFALFQF